MRRGMQATHQRLHRSGSASPTAAAAAGCDPLGRASLRLCLHARIASSTPLPPQASGTSLSLAPKTLRACGERRWWPESELSVVLFVCRQPVLHTLADLPACFHRIALCSEWPYEKPVVEVKRRKPKGHKHDREKPQRCGGAGGGRQSA